MENALDIGKAAEHLVCADLILQGHTAFLSDQGLPFDVLAMFGGRLIRVQVKATQTAKNVNAQGRNARLAYSWHIRRRGRSGKGSRLDETHCDVVALVALDTRQIAYLPLDMCAQTVQIDKDPCTVKRTTKGISWASGMEDFPFADAIGTDRTVYAGKRKEFQGYSPVKRQIRTYEQSKRYRENRKAKLAAAANPSDRAVQGLGA